MCRFISLSPPALAQRNKPYACNFCLRVRVTLRKDALISAYTWSQVRPYAGIEAELQALELRHFVE